MSNARKKSIADLIGSKKLSKKPSSLEIDKITSKIHEPEKQPIEKITQLPVTEKTKRIGLIVPVSLYLKAKTKSTLQDQSLLGYIGSLIAEDVKNLDMHK